MLYLTETVPPYGLRQEITPGVERIVARNPGRMTYHGTNSFLIGDVLIDPGPDDAAHVAALAAAGPIGWILVTHTHADHVGALPALQQATGARVAGAAVGEVRLRDGDEVAGFEVVATPGHASDHLCFARDGVLFTGDHVMAWSSSMVALPDGDMGDYLASLARVMARPEGLFLPAHGPALAEPRPFVAGLMAHRLGREAEILAALPGSVSSLVSRLYARVDPGLWPAAERVIGAHLAKLASEGRVVVLGEFWQAVGPSSHG